MKKRMTIVALMLAMLTLLTACGPNIEGTWKMTGVTGAETTKEETAVIQQTIDSGFMVRTFTFKGGRFTQKITYSEGGDSITGTDEYGGKYRIDGNHIVFISDGADQTSTSVEFRLEGNTLEMIAEDGSMIFTRQN